MGDTGRDSKDKIILDLCGGTEASQAFFEANR
jgi:hypothetical protein